MFLLCFSFSGAFNGKNDEQKAPYQDIAEKILKRGLKEEQAFAFLKKLTGIGPRLSGSPQAAAAVELVRQEMEGLGFDNVHLEPTVVEHWVRGPREKSRTISSKFGTVSLNIRAIGGSMATPDSGILVQEFGFCVCH